MALLAMTSVAVAACATAPAAPAAPAATGLRDVAPTAAQAQILAQAQRAADWQLAHMDADTSGIRRPSRETYNPRGWVMGTFFVGLADLDGWSGDARYRDALQAVAQRNQWQLGVRPTHADDHLVGLVYLRLQPASGGAAEQLAPMRATFDAILANPPQASLEFIEEPGVESRCQQRWCWADALFMAPATWVALSERTGDRRYADYAHREFWAATDYLFDPEAGFFFRDSRFFARRGPDGEKVYWARGNGWVFGGIVNILRAMRADDPQRPRYIALFRRMADALVAVQQDNGNWHTSLHARRPEPPESSGTGFFTYGLAYGVNSGILVGDRYTSAARAGWGALNRNVDADGRLGYVQQVGDRPGDVQADDVQFYGTGAYLLAARQMYQLEGAR